MSAGRTHLRLRWYKAMLKACALTMIPITAYAADQGLLAPKAASVAAPVQSIAMDLSKPALPDTSPARAIQSESNAAAAPVRDKSGSGAVLLAEMSTPPVGSIQMPSGSGGADVSSIVLTPPASVFVPAAIDVTGPANSAPVTNSSTVASIGMPPPPAGPSSQLGSLGQDGATPAGSSNSIVQAPASDQPLSGFVPVPFGRQGPDKPTVLAAAPVPPSPGVAPAKPPARINTTKQDITLTVPLRDPMLLGQVDVTITPQDEIFVKAEDLANAMQRIAKPDQLDRIRKLADPAGRISAAALAQAGYPITFDGTASELFINIPVDGRNTLDLSLGIENNIQPVQPDHSAPFAAFVNYRFGETYALTGSNSDRFDFVGDLQFSGRVVNTVAFDNYATLDQRSDHVFTRNASRLVYDWPDPAIRVSAGDLMTSATAFQSDPSIAGINFSHLMSVFYPTYAMSGYDSQNLTLTRESDVQVLVNNIPVSQLHLQPGTYNMHNLPLAQGSNNVQAIVTDDTGQRRVVNFSYFSDSNLLQAGIDEYTFSAGVLAHYGRSGPNYSNDLAMSGFYRRGITNQLTAGLNAQADRENRMVGLDGTFGTEFGLISVNLAGNHLRDGTLGGAARMQYRYAESGPTPFSDRTFDVSAEYRTEHFGDITAFNPANAREWLFAADFMQPIDNDLMVQFTGNYAMSRLTDDDSGAVSALLSWNTPLNAVLGAGITYQWAPSRAGYVSSVGGQGLSFALSLTMRLDQATMVQVSGDNFQQRAYISRSPIEQVNDWYANGDVSHANRGYSGNADVGYQTNRGDVDINYNASLDEHGSIAGQSLGAYFAGSLAFADNKFAIGRRISDSFAIVDADESLGDRHVLIQDRFANHVTAQSDFFGPALVQSPSYNGQSIPYDVADIPPGYNLGDGNFQVYPWYHSGYGLTVGSKYNVSAVGFLLGPSDQPLTLRTGTAVSEDDPSAPHVDVITNRAGRFVALGLAPGKWKITMSGPEQAEYEISIGKDEGMLVKFGRLKPIGAPAEPAVPGVPTPPQPTGKERG